MSAFYVWWLVLLVLAFLYRGQKPQALLCLFLLLYLGTLLLGPVAWLRYVFPFMLTLPGLTGLLFIREEW